MNSIQIAAALAQEFEGFKSHPYLCPAGKWTIGFGARFLPNGNPVTKIAAPITRQQADAMLEQSMIDSVHDVGAIVKVPLNPNQLAALADFAFNVGIHALESSTLLKLLNSGDYNGASNQFTRWVYASRYGIQKVEAGLVARRNAERNLFLKKAK